MPSNYSKVSFNYGMRPGSPVYRGSRTPKPTRIKAFVYTKEKFEDLSKITPEKIQQHLSEGCHVWIDICGLADVQPIIQFCEDLSIHPLMIEDILNTNQRPKLDVINEYTYIVLKYLDAGNGHYNYHTEQISLINRGNLLITVRESSLCSFDHLYERFSLEHALVHKEGSNFLMYQVIDTIVGDYFRFIESTDDQLDKMENLLIDNPDELNLKTFYTTKRRTTTLRKVISPLRDVVHILLSEHPREPHDTFQIYYQNLHDHCVRLLEQVDVHREISASMLDIYLSIQNNRMNETMKILTLFASIFIPLSFIASVYGMNFVNMPELRWPYSYPLILLIMLTLAIGMLIYFKRKRIF